MFASGAMHGLYYIAESTFGVTPTSPAMKQVRHVSCDLDMKRGQIESREVRTDRGLVDVRLGNRRPDGNFGVELSAGNFDDFLEAVLAGTWATNELKQGVTRRSFTFLRRFTDITQNLTFTGVAINTMNVTIRPEQMVNVTFGVIAKNTTPGVPSGVTYVDANSKTPMSSYGCVLKEAGATIAVISGIEFTLENGLAHAFVVGSDTAPQFTWRRSRLTGTLTAFVEDLALWTKFINETSSTLELTLSFGGDSYKLEFPKVKYTGASLPQDGDDEIQSEIPFMGLYDAAVEDSNLVITRTIV